MREPQTWLSLRRARRQTLAEYALILTLVAVAVVVPSVLLFRNDLIAGFAAAANCLNRSC